MPSVLCVNFNFVEASVFLGLLLLFVLLLAFRPLASLSAGSSWHRNLRERMSNQAKLNGRIFGNGLVPSEILSCRCATVSTCQLLMLPCRPFASCKALFCLDPFYSLEYAWRCGKRRFELQLERIQLGQKQSFGSLDHFRVNADGEHFVSA